ncbi:MAG TPA: 2-oxoacid:acceptor oxidoreductase subunit alpha [Planctomycetota bacterium]|nr:2-oxoacid:acceptor oxidoreductase subunit alpha [Planctomycetota bacterium]
MTIRFAGDSGDGIQLTGGQFTNATAIAGNDLATFPDFPAEIRAPAGTLPGVSGFQVQFSSSDIHTPGDRPDVLVAFNPAGLKVNVGDLPQNGVIIANSDEFKEANLKKAGYETDPLEDGSLAKFRLYKVPVTTLTIRALESSPLSNADKELCKNFFCLGMMYWLYTRPLEPTENFLRTKFSKKPDVMDANITALRAGFNFADTTEIFQVHYEVPPAALAPGTYRNIMGNPALAIGLIVASHKCGLRLVYCGYPITPASTVLHELAPYKHYGVITFQAEDEIAAVTAAIGASFAGSLGVTGSSGPGIALKAEAVNLAVMTELPLVILNIQRAGPSTGMPTKTEQADLLQALFGRNSESPACVLAPQSPGDCFDIALEAVRIAVKYMTPVYILSDGYIANGSEPWLIPDVDKIPKIEVKFQTDPEGFEPYVRDPQTLGRPWVKPGTPGLEHRIGGIEKSHIHGNVCYDPDNHDFMIKLRAQKVARIAQDIPPAEAIGPQDARLLVLGWGGTYGHIRAAIELCQKKGLKVARTHLRYLNPFPYNLGALLSRYERVLIPEINLGQLRLLVRAKFLVDASGLNKVSGQPFKVAEIVEAIERELETM